MSSTESKLPIRKNVISGENRLGLWIDPFEFSSISWVGCIVESSIRLKNCVAADLFFEDCPTYK